MALELLDHGVAGYSCLARRGKMLKNSVAKSKSGKKLQGKKLEKVKTLMIRVS